MRDHDSRNHARITKLDMIHVDPYHTDFDLSMELLCLLPVAYRKIDGALYGDIVYSNSPLIHAPKR